MTQVLEGKTKRIELLPVEIPIGVVHTKKDITAFDGEKHDFLEEKIELSTRTTCNVFDMLRRKGIPLAYIGRDSPTTFLTHICEMIPVEIVVHRIALGSYCERNPVAKGTRFNSPLVEFFLKTSGRKFEGQEMPCDDPLMELSRDGNSILLHHSHKPIGEPFGVVEAFTPEYVRTLFQHLNNEAEPLAVEVFELLEEAFKEVGVDLQDFKIECGIAPHLTDQVRVADVIDCDSWRAVWNGFQLSKQPYRDGDDLGKVLAGYRIAASLTDHFVR